MIFGLFTLFVALVISTVAAYYSIVGLTAIFSAAVIPILIMGASLEVGKVTAAVWLKLNWERAGFLYKLYLVPAVAFLMVLTSMGIFGFLSKAHSDQSLVSGDSMAKVAIYDEKIKVSKDNIDANRKALKQMDEAVDQVMGRSTDEKGADKAVAIRRGQQAERKRLLSEIESEQKKISQLNEERAPIAAEFRKVESEVGPIKYIAALVYGDNPDQTILEKAVRLVIIIIVAVFDPLALVLIIAAQQSIRWAREDKRKSVDEQSAVGQVAVMDADPTDQKVVTDQQTTEEVDRFAYLKQPFIHFKNLIPMPAKSEQTIIDDVAAISNEPQPEPPKEEPAIEMSEEFKAFVSDDSTGTLPQPEPDLHVYDDERLVSNHDKRILAVGIDVVDRPGDYIEPPQEWTGPMKEVIEEHIDPNTRIKTFNHKWVPDLSPQADNGPDGHPINADFGTAFPPSPEQGDMYVRVDYLPPRLFKYVGNKWVEKDKDSTESYYSEEYIKHLIDKIKRGEYAVEDLSESEQDQIRDYLSNQP